MLRNATNAKTEIRAALSKVNVSAKGRGAGRKMGAASAKGITKGKTEVPRPIPRPKK